MLTLSRPVACSALQLTPLCALAFADGAKTGRVEDVVLEDIRCVSTADGIVTDFSARLPNGRWVQLHDWVVTAPDGTHTRYGPSEFAEHFSSLEHAVNHLDTERAGHLDWPPVVSALVDAVGVLRARGTADASHAVAKADAAIARAGTVASERREPLALHQNVTADELAAAERAVLHATTLSARMDAVVRFKALVVRSVETRHDPVATLISEAATPRRATIAHSARTMAVDDGRPALARDIVTLRQVAEAADRVSDQRIYFHPGETDAMRRVCDAAAGRALHLNEAEHGPVIEDVVLRAIGATPGAAIGLSAQRAIAAHAADAVVAELNKALDVTPPTRVTPVTAILHGTLLSAPSEQIG